MSTREDIQCHYSLLRWKRNPQWASIASLPEWLKYTTKAGNRCGYGFRERESLIKWHNTKQFLKNTKCPTTGQPSPCAPVVSVRQTKNAKWFMGMFRLVWFIKAPDWKQHSDLLMTEGWTNRSISTAGNKEKRSKFQKVPPCVVPLIWEENTEMERRLGKEREATRRCVERQGQPGWSLWWWKHSDVYYDINTLCVNSTTVSQLVLWEAEREIRELEKGTWLC